MQTTEKPNEDIRAIGLCAGCGKKKFNIFVYKDGSHHLSCANCGKAWEAPHRVALVDLGGDQTVAEAGDVGEDVVSKAKREMRNQHIRYADPTR